MGCCLPKPKAKQPSEPWKIKFGHIRPLREDEKKEARKAYKAYLDQKLSDFRSKLRSQCPREEASNFDVSGVLGQGALGTVTVAQRKKTGEFYAVEIIRKKDILDQASMTMLSREKTLLYATSNDHIVQLFMTCVTPKELFLVEELSPYGDLYRCVVSRMCLEEKKVSIYAAQLVLALEYLHHCEILHRDLRSENVLVFRDGYLKLCRFVCAKIVPRSTASFVGSPDIKPPEVYKREMYSKGVDWWALGILIYEMLCGQLPFAASDTIDRKQCCQKIIRDPVLFNEGFGMDARDIITKLLAKNPRERIGNLANGADDVKDHAFFAGINFIGIHEKKYKIDIVFKPLVPTGFPKGEDDSLSSSSYESLFRDF